jgi:xylulokinase
VCVIGMDVGTTGLKAVLSDETGKIVGQSNQSYEVSQPRANWFEQDPEKWWVAAQAAVAELLVQSAEHSEREIAAIGLSGQYHGLVALDEVGEVVRPAILWNDQRTADQYRYVVEKIGKDTLLNVCASIGGLYWTVCKLLWVKDNEPENYKRVKKMLLPKDYIRYRLSGEFATDVTDASGTGLLDLATRQWSDKLCGLLGVDVEVLPIVYESAEVTGTISSVVANQLGLSEETLVVAGGGDQACAAIGNGIFDEGVIGLSLGTSGVLYAATDEPRTDEDGRLDTFCHAVPNRWALLGVTNSAAASLSWLVDSFFPVLDGEKAQTYARVQELSKSVAAGSGGLVFLPYLAGERHPHRDANARGVFFGLNSQHTQAHAYRAVMEGVAYSFRQCVDIMRGLGVQDREFRGTGGGFRSATWASIQASVLGGPILGRTESDTGAAYGAAILALVGSGEYGSIDEIAQLNNPFVPLSKPEEAERVVYDRLFKLYADIYPRLKPLFDEVAEIQNLT